jgi:hypothetical protein
MIQLIPFRHLILRTSLNCDRAVSILSATLKTRRRQPSLLRWFQGKSNRYYGKVSDTGFRVSRRYPTWSDASAVAIAYGKFREQPNGTEIDVRIMPHPIVMLVAVLSCLAFGFHFISTLVEWARTGSARESLFPLWLFMLTFFAVGIWIFQLEANAASDFIEDTYGRYRTSEVKTTNYSVDSVTQGDLQR